MSDRHEYARGFKLKWEGTINKIKENEKDDNGYWKNDLGLVVNRYYIILGAYNDLHNAPFNNSFINTAVNEAIRKEVAEMLEILERFGYKI